MMTLGFQTLPGFDANASRQSLPSGDRLTLASSKERARTAELAPLIHTKPARDLALDFIRGLAIFFMVTDHLLFVSGYSFLTRERFGIVTGAEIFVLISGVLIGNVYRDKIARLGFNVAAKSLIARAVQLYFVCLALIVGVFLFSLIPGVDTKLITPWGWFNLRDGIHQVGLLKIFTHSLLLKCGPPRMNVIGIYVVLLTGAPIAMWLLTKGWTKTLLVLSGLVWAINLFFQARLIATAFDNVFRVLSWQFLFVIGIVAGYHRQIIRDFIYSTKGRWCVAAAAAMCLAMCFLALHNPSTALPRWARLHVIPPHVFRRLYDHFFRRKVLAPGRMINVVCLFLVLYVTLKSYWNVTQKTLGWFFVTIGQASLYVYILHAFLLQAIYQIPGLDDRHVLLNTLVATGVLLLLWVMTKKRILFWLIPR